MSETVDIRVKAAELRLGDVLVGTDKGTGESYQCEVTLIEQHGGESATIIVNDELALGPEQEVWILRTYADSPEDES